ncbi:MAG: hypothetical protein HYU25_03270 [Candidatus Rokubacteria bacterium]|nr:hypothetical protein [Candidatus Rokubacteria bacterium]
MNLAALGEENVRKYGEYVVLAFEGREWTNVEQQRVAKFKCPKQVRFVESLPKNPVGKILRKELRVRAGS